MWEDMPNTIILDDKTVTIHLPKNPESLPESQIMVLKLTKRSSQYPMFSPGTELEN